MPDFGTPVATNVNPQAGMQTLSNLMGLQQQSQAIQSKGIGIQQQQQELQSQQAAAVQATMSAKERQQVAPVMQSLPKDDQGNIDWNQSLPAIMKAAPSTWPSYVQAGAQAQAAVTNAKTNIAQFDATTRGYVGDALYSLKDQPPENAIPFVQGLVKQYPQLAPAAQLWLPALQKAGTNPQAVSAVLDGAGKMVQNAPQQQTMNTPTALPVQTATGPQAINTKPGVPGIPQGGVVPGSAGAYGGEAAATGNVGVNQAHYAGVQSAAGAAANRIAQLDTIKTQIPAAAAAMGPQDFVRSFIGKVYTAFGLGDASQTALDVMAKQVAQLANSSGNTDLGKNLSQAGTPNFHMTPTAATQTADQLIGMAKKDAAAPQVFSKIPLNSPAYGEAMTKWAANADPRLFESGAFDPATHADWLKQHAASLKQLSSKAAVLKEMGVQP